MSKNILQVNIKDGDDELAILANFLRNGQITSRAIMALRAFYLSLAISESPTSTAADIRKAEHHCLSLLKQQMCYIMDKHYREDGIKMDADEFSSVTINQQALSNLGLLPLVQSSSIVDVVSRSENGEVSASIGVPSQSLDIVDLQETPIVKKAEEEKAEEDEDEDDEDEDEDDPYEGMTDEEYLVATKHLLKKVNIK